MKQHIDTDIKLERKPINTALKRLIERDDPLAEALALLVNHDYRREITQGLKEVEEGKDTPIDDLFD